jgi:hypothetical protein
MLRGVNPLPHVCSSSWGRLYNKPCNIRPYFGVPKPAPPKFEVAGVPNVLTLPNDTRRLSFDEPNASLVTGSLLANGDDLSGE